MLDRDHARLAEPGHPRAAGRHRRHRQRRVRRLLEPGRAPARGRRRQRPLRRPRVRARRGLRHQTPTATRDCDCSTTSTSRPTPTRCLYPVDVPRTAASVARARREQPGLRRRGLDRLPARTTTTTASATRPTHTSPAPRRSPATPADPTMWEDDVIPLDADGVARPIIGLGFSTARPLDIRAGGGEDEVSYNVNAPVSVDGGTGFDKLVVLGTEFADDIVITVKGIFGAGLNVRYDNDRGRRGRRPRGRRRVLRPLDRVRRRLPRDRRPRLRHDQRRRRRRRGHRHPRARGRQRHDRPPRRRRRLDDVSTTACRSTASTTTSPRPTSGQVIIDETGPGTSVREGGSARPVPDDRLVLGQARGRPRRQRLRHGLGGSLAAGGGRRHVRQPGAARTASNSLDDGEADIDLAVHGGHAPATCATTHERLQALQVVNGVLVDENNRALVLTFTGGLGGNWDDRAVGLRLRRRRPALRGRPRRRRPALDDLRRTRSSTQVAGPQRRGQLRDNDTPGVYVTQVDAGHVRRGQAHARDRGRVLQPGRRRKPHDVDPTDGRSRGLHRLDDELLIQLQKDPGPATIRVKLVARRREPAGDPARPAPIAGATLVQARRQPTNRCCRSPTTRSTSTPRTGTMPVRVTINARPDARGRTRRRRSSRLCATTSSHDDLSCLTATSTRRRHRRLREVRHRRRQDRRSRTWRRYVVPEPPLRHRHDRRSRCSTTRPPTCHDRERRRHASSQKCGNTVHAPGDPPTPASRRRLVRRSGSPSSRPADGRRRDPHRRHGRRDRDQRRRRSPLVELQGDRRPVPIAPLPRQPPIVDATASTITRANGSDLGSFVDEGFAAPAT